MTTIETLEHEGLRIEIMQDEEPMSPREADNLGTMVCSHDRYALGDVQARPGEPHDLPWGVRVALPLYLLDHSGLAMQAGVFSEDPGGWDSGQVGVIYVTTETLEREGLADLTDAEIEGHLEGEVETYDQYLQGDVYGFIIERLTTCDQGHEHAETIDSCWGFYGIDDARAEALDAAAAYAAA